MSKSHTPHAISKENNYIWLMIALLVLLFCSALSDQLGSDVLSRFMGVLLTLTILLAPILLLIAAVRPTALPPVIAIQLVLGSRWIVHQRTTTRSLIGSPAQQLMAEGALAVLLATVAPLLAIGMMIVAIWPLSGRAIRAERRLE